MDKPDIIIGIDPYVNKSGFAQLDCKTMDITIDTLISPELVKKLRKVKDQACANRNVLRVAVEASWLISHNWHVGNGKVRGAGAKAKSVTNNLPLALMIKA